MDILRTDRTYKTRANAVKHLATELGKLGLTLTSVRYLIATNEEGRFAPVVISNLHGPYGPAINSLIFNGVTVVN